MSIKLFALTALACATVFSLSCSRDPKTTQSNNPTTSWQQCVSQAQNSFGDRVRWAQSRWPIEVGYDSDMPPQFINALTSAIDDWNNAANQRLLVIKSISGSAAPIQFHFVTTWHFEKEDKEAATALDFQDSLIRNVNVYLNSGLFQFSTSAADHELDVATVFRHELGHALGLSHTSESSIMRPNIPYAETLPLTDYDKQAIQCAYGAQKEI